MDLKERIRHRLSTLSLRRLDGDFEREAAVLIPVFEKEHAPHFLLTLRTQEVETHKGQISFPGGARHPGESLEATALRETFEEVGLPVTHVDLLGRFHEYRSSTSFRVVPFAGYLDQSFLPNPQPREVAEILEVPFRIFFEPERLRMVRMHRLGEWIDVPFYSYGGHQIWGLTARIIKDFLEVIGPDEERFTTGK